MVLAAAFGSEKLTPRGVAGALVCLVGIAWIICRGSVDALLNVSFNLGDIVMMVAAAYSDERPSTGQWFSEAPPTGALTWALGELAFYYGACWLYHRSAPTQGQRHPYY
jgi:hypothetical protein